MGFLERRLIRLVRFGAIYLPPRRERKKKGLRENDPQPRYIFKYIHIYLSI